MPSESRITTCRAWVGYATRMPPRSIPDGTTARMKAVLRSRGPVVMTPHHDFQGLHAQRHFLGRHRKESLTETVKA